MSTLVSILLGVVLNALGADLAEVRDNTSETEISNCKYSVQYACPTVKEAHYIISKNDLLSQNL